MNFRNVKIFILLITPALFLAGCAGMREVTVATVPQGLYHKVHAKETLWRISKNYGVELEALARANSLTDKQTIYVGQLLFIPQAAVTKFRETGKSKNFIWPIRGKVLSYYGEKKDGVKNKGIDIKARHGEAIVASRSGEVSFTDENMKGFGKTIIIEHNDGYSTVYAYNSQILIGVGRKVRQGTVIAKAGQSGRAPAPRLHFEIRKEHKPQNPIHFLQ